MFFQKPNVRYLDESYHGDSCGTSNNANETELSDKARIQALEDTVRAQQLKINLFEKKFEIYDELIKKLSKK